jgi:hypothetical protein
MRARPATTASIVRKKAERAVCVLAIILESRPRKCDCRKVELSLSVKASDSMASKDSATRAEAASATLLASRPELFAYSFETPALLEHPFECGPANPALFEN